MIMQGASPEYDHCVAISTQASLREMIAPGPLAISMSNSGGAWDNAKKYIEAGGLGPGKGKKTPPHANAVIGDTVGDPLKDTSGPALNIVMKLCAIMSLVFGSVIADYSNSQGGPKWLSVA